MQDHAMTPKMPWMEKWLESSQISFKSNYRQTTDQRMVQKKGIFMSKKKNDGSMSKDESSSLNIL